MRSSEFNVDNIPGLREIRDQWFARAAKVVPVDLAALSMFPDNSPVSVHNTEQAHYSSMIENLSVAQWANNKLGPCTYSSSYSMGLFSALVHSGAIEFEASLQLVKSVWDEAMHFSQDGVWAVGAVIDFPEARLSELIQDQSAFLEITDTYGIGTLLFTGEHAAVKAVLDLALIEGAAATRLIPLSAPFHTSKLRGIEPKISALIEQIRFSNPNWPILSSLDQSWIRTCDDVRFELCRNISAPMNWLGTIGKLADTGVGTMIECGASFSLTELAKQSFPDSFQYFNYRNFSTLQ